jgi:hypothetical protein
MNAQVADDLRRATDGLMYQSESDEPFEVVQWPDEGAPLDPERLLELTAHDSETPMDVLSLTEFFEDLMTEEDWQSDAERAIARKYQALEHIFRTELRGSKAFWLGEIEVDIYVIGVTPEGDWVGVKTKAVET